MRTDEVLDHDIQTKERKAWYTQAEKSSGDYRVSGV